MYNKPLILTNDDMAEGVYAASGQSSASYTLEAYNTNIGEYYSQIQYHLYLTNKGQETVSSLTVTLSVTGDNVNAVVIYANNPDGSVNWSGSTATVSFNNNGNPIAPGATICVDVEINGKGQIGLA